MATRKQPEPIALETLDALQRIASGIAEHNERQRRAERDTPEARAELEAMRKPLRKMSLATFARAVPDLYRAIANGIKVPDQYLDRSAGATTVACPCEEAPQLIADTPAFCVCGRAYVTVGRDVLVLFSPVKSADADHT